MRTILTLSLVGTALSLFVMAASNFQSWVWNERYYDLVLSTSDATPKQEVVEVNHKAALCQERSERHASQSSYSMIVGSLFLVIAIRARREQRSRRDT